MKCSDLQLNLPLFADDILSPAERADIDGHLPACPLCRQKLSEFQSIRTGLRELSRPAIPGSLLNSIRASVGDALAMQMSFPAFQLVESKRGWLDVWLMPSAVAGLATVILGFTLLSAMLTGSVRTNSDPAQISSTSSPSIYLSSVDGEPILTASTYARSRMAVAGESPSVNPQGALVALTRSLVRGEMKDDEVTVVADVFGNGLAQIAEVVEPSHDRNAVAELQKALQSDPAFAPFVSADL
ncbi:MAG TPA: zf-HC2 domain-containing protein, partial [Pyrinomonadaceae bacterium]|nr:zf-HC2 domain-containing protein [Pyrinomonadaceae bacterium]